MQKARVVEEHPTNLRFSCPRMDYLARAPTADGTGPD